ncbi:MAG: hypothetical protein OEW60_03160 [Thiovulaceae bacterium]|nr:hypothetical protein [Sulfurimonadaceae bacterium]
MIRYIPLLLLTFCLAFTACSDQEQEASIALTQAVPTTNEVYDSSMQLGEKDRNAQAEMHFINQVKTLIQLDDAIGFKKLYYLENANPEYLPMIDYIYNKNWSKNFNDIHISIEVNQKAKQHNIYFTTPYLGDLVILLQNQYGKSHTKVPLGIKDGNYYFTLGSKR